MNNTNVNRDYSKFLVVIISKDSGLFNGFKTKFNISKDIIDLTETNSSSSSHNVNVILSFINKLKESNNELKESDRVILVKCNTNIDGDNILNDLKNRGDQAPFVFVDGMIYEFIFKNNMNGVSNLGELLNTMILQKKGLINSGVTQEGGAKKQKKLAKSSEKIKIGNQTRVIYIGTRGGRYVKMNGNIVPVSKLNKN